MHDAALAAVTTLPGFPMSCWNRASSLPLRDRWELRTWVATAMREAFEEMRLSPFGVEFLGLLEPQPLWIHQRLLVPVVMRQTRPQTLRPDWEVESIVTVNVRELLDPSRYARFRVTVADKSAEVRDEWIRRVHEDLLCFRVSARQMLWGATFRLTMRWLEKVFGFVPPTSGLPLVERRLTREYFSGKRL